MRNRLIEEADIAAVYFPRKKMPADGFDAEDAQTTKRMGEFHGGIFRIVQGGGIIFV